MRFNSEAYNKAFPKKKEEIKVESTVENFEVNTEDTDENESEYCSEGDVEDGNDVAD